ncbi:hypothetical protein G7007_13085 [Pseudomonas entomophila]|jgi:hypothetical protein|uniref:hypothetical protein n=1 Tax=Pseudomonas entomophila TaxID=312306 RepID=UPI0015E28777|nr:hypothetical protein [Pseudomonas entomophila]MBA1193785.1 hypothetical protein [Pseudomonas entomophila]
MHGSKHEDGEHSTSEPDPRYKAWKRMLLSLALFGVLVGLMIGRLTAPQTPVLEQVQVLEGGLDLWFDEAPKLHGELVDGTVAVLFEATGAPARGQVHWQGKPVAWQLRARKEGLFLILVAARPLRGDWHGAEEAGRWRVRVTLRE